VAHVAGSSRAENAVLRYRSGRLREVSGIARTPLWPRWTSGFGPNGEQAARRSRRSVRRAPASADHRRSLRGYGRWPRF